MRGAWIIAALTLAGCSDPNSSRLEPGTQAIVLDWTGEGGDVHVDMEAGHGLLGASFAKLKPGTRVTVVDDSAPEDGPGQRDVQVNISEGKYAGELARLPRTGVKPVPR